MRAATGGNEIEPVFAVTLLDRRGRTIAMRAGERNWNPARLELKYRLSHALVTERRTVLASDVFVSHWSLSHAADLPRYFWLVLWTRRPQRIGGRLLSDIEANAQGISFHESLSTGTDGQRVGWSCALGASFDADSWSVSGSQSSGPQLVWEDTPFYELMTPGGLPGQFPAHDDNAGYLFLGLAYPFEIGPSERLGITFAAAFAPEVEQARANLDRTVSLINPIQASEEDWINWFEDIPWFSCSDPHLQKLYWLLWAKRRLNGRSPVAGERERIARVIDGAWQHSSDEALGELVELLSLPAERVADLALAHASRRVFANHPDRNFLHQATERLLPLANVADTNAGLPMAVCRQPWRNEKAKRPSLIRSLWLCDLLHLLRCFTSLDQRPRTPGAVRDWKSLADGLAQQIHEEFWSDDQRFFTEHVTADGNSRRAMTAFGFYPLLVDLASSNERAALTEHLCDPEKFWTRCPLPTLARDDPDFSPEGHWQNQRVDDPFHGRMWLEVNSHVIDGLGAAIERRSAVDRLLLAGLLKRTFEVVYLDQEIDQPILTAHYNPLTGQPGSSSRCAPLPGGWLIDHLLRYVAGVRPNVDGSVVLDPLPLDLEWLSVSRVFVGNHELTIDWDHRVGLTVHVDDELAGHAPVGQALHLTLPDHWVERGVGVETDDSASPPVTGQP